MPSEPANGGRNGPRPRRPDSARSRLPSVLRDSSRRRRNGHPADQVDLVQTTDDPRRLTNKITIYGWSTRPSGARSISRAHYPSRIVDRACAIGPSYVLRRITVVTEM